MLRYAMPARFDPLDHGVHGPVNHAVVSLTPLPELEHRRPSTSENRALLYAPAHGTMTVPVLPSNASTVLSRELMIARFPPSCTNLMAEATLGPMLPGRK